MRSGARLLMMMAGSAILAAAMSAHGEQAFRTIGALDRNPAVQENAAALSRWQSSPQFAAQRLQPRGGSIVEDMASVRRPAGPDMAREGRRDDRLASDHVASMTTTRQTKMRTVSMQPIELPAEAMIEGGRSGAGGSGVAKEVEDVAPTVIRFDRMVININFAGFGL
jgi:hypothetical protein